MAMKPFLRLQLRGLLEHWFSFDQRASRLPKIFHGQLVPPGSQRQVSCGRDLATTCAVLRWMIDRCKGPASGARNADRLVAERRGRDLAGTDVRHGSDGGTAACRCALWRAELDDVGSYLAQISATLPEAAARGASAQLDRCARLKNPHPDLSHYVGEGARGSGVISPRQAKRIDWGDVDSGV